MHTEQICIYRPIDLHAFESKRIYGMCVDTRRQDAIVTKRDRKIQAWQQRWTQETKDNLIRRLIKDLKPWIIREFEDMNFYVSQLLTGYDYFRRYLYCRIKVENTGLQVLWTRTGQHRTHVIQMCLLDRLQTETGNIGREHLTT